MVDMFRSFFEIVYKMRVAFLLTVVIAVILSLSAYVGSNIFFNKDKTQASATSGLTVQDKKMAAVNQDNQVESAPQRPAEGPTLVTNSTKPAAVCDINRKNQITRQQKLQTASENELYLANVSNIRNGATSTIASLSSSINGLLETEDQRHSVALKTIETTARLELLTISCLSDS